MNEIQIFESEQFGAIRTMVMPDGQIGFVGKDVAEVLGYSNATKAIIMHVDDDDKEMVMLEAQSQNGILVKTKTAIINESGLYSLVLSSKLPQAREFKRWVTSEVLPQIRQTGGYIPLCPGDDEKTILHRAVQVLQKTVEQKEALINAQFIELAEQDVEIAHLTPKAQYAEHVLMSPSCYTMSQVAKSLSMSVFELQRLLHQHRIIYRAPSGPWMLYAPYLKQGLEAYRTSYGKDAKGKTTWSDSYLVWTERGKEFIHNLLGRQAA